ncbi:hypothetical protein DYB32_003103 [Aphanomyces invadans]|uniref:Uncharacterized protein n=1 Tax=Aphanomyces invadans TaxID=157072 RepID=A0A418B1J7_9STRA|nr:hypothetical protein DYB32_003103 [Aphanomyces invadans]
MHPSARWMRILRQRSTGAPAMNTEGGAACTMEVTHAPDELDTDLLDAADIKLQKNKYQREKQGKYRQQEHALRAHLRRRVAELEAMLLRVKRRGSLMLSWEDIAITMREARDVAVVENQRLHQQIQHVRTLMNDMRRWVSPCHANATWRNFTLLRHPESRKVGMEWITQQLYHNLDNVQKQYGFPPMFSTVTEDDLNVVFDDDGCYQFIRRHELFMQHSLDELRGVMQADIWQFMINYARLHVCRRPRAPRRLMVTSRRFAATPHTREFIDSDRIVYVGQQIHEDEDAPTMKLQRHRHVWYILQRISPTVTKIRMLFIVSSSFSKDGQTPLCDEARGFWDLDLHGLDEDTMQRKFRQHALAVCDVRHHQRLDQYLKSVNTYLRERATMRKTEL